MTIGIVAEPNVNAVTVNENEQAEFTGTDPIKQETPELDYYALFMLAMEKTLVDKYCGLIIERELLLEELDCEERAWASDYDKEVISIDKELAELKQSAVVQDYIAQEQANNRNQRWAIERLKQRYGEFHEQLNIRDFFVGLKAFRCENVVAPKTALL